MKKNVIMRAACVVLVLTLLSTCMISGTFAKYVTTGPAATDSARVAEWGVTIEATGVMFGDSYQDKASGNAATAYVVDEAVDTITVQAKADNTNIVAPGTKGSLAALNVQGTPEVDTQVTYVADLALEKWTVDVTNDGVDNAVYYCPLVITIDDGEDATPAEVFNGATYASATEFEEAVEAAIVAKAARYHTNQDLSAVNNDVQVSWEWPFEVGANEDEIAANDAKDTALGNAAATPDDNSGAATVALTITATITQID